MKIITISREFGSGGRELGKRLADALGIPCYDHEIIDMVAEQHGFDKNYVAHISEKDIRMFYPTTIAHRFIAPHPIVQQKLQIMTAEHNIIKQLAGQAIALNAVRSLVMNTLVITLLPKIFGNAIVWHTFGIYEVLVLIMAFILKKSSERNGVVYK